MLSFLRGGRWPFGQPAGSFVMLLQLVDTAPDVLGAVLQDLLCDLFLIENDNLLD